MQTLVLQTFRTSSFIMEICCDMKIALGPLLSYNYECTKLSALGETLSAVAKYSMSSSEIWKCDINGCKSTCFNRSNFYLSDEWSLFIVCVTCFQVHYLLSSSGQAYAYKSAFSTQTTCDGNTLQEAKGIAKEIFRCCTAVHTFLCLFVWQQPLAN